MLAYFGLIKTTDQPVSYPDNFSFTDNTQLKLDYLKSLDAQEVERQTTIDTKTSQLIGQTGVIFSLVGLFIPMYIDKFSQLNLIYQVIIIAVFLFTLLFYLLAIAHATKYLNVKNYKYAQRSTETVKKNYEKNKDFRIEEVKDLIYSIEKNTGINNRKAGNLIYGYRAFRAGNILIGILSVLLLFSIYFMPKEETKKVTIDSVELKSLDSSIKEMNSLLKSQIILRAGDSVQVIHIK